MLHALLLQTKGCENLQNKKESYRKLILSGLKLKLNYSRITSSGSGAAAVGTEKHLSVVYKLRKLP